MAGNELPSLGRVKLSDLVASEGLPTDSYKLSVSTLCHSLAQYSAAIIQFSSCDGALLRSGLESARLYFHQRPSYPVVDMIHSSESQEWCRTSGYYADPEWWQESYDYRPGLTHLETVNEMEIPPAGLVDIFKLLAKAARDVLDAIGFNLNLRSSPFTEILDNVPLRSREISSSLLSVSCHARPSFHGAHDNLASHDDGHLTMFPELDYPNEKCLISIVKSDKAGLHIRDFHGHWVLVDADLGPQEAVIYPGLALYQATAGYISPAVQRIEVSNPQGNVYGRSSLIFKLMPKSMTNLNYSEMIAAGHGVEAHFQLPVPVDDFMQRSHPADQLFNGHTLSNFNFPVQDGIVTLTTVSPVILLDSQQASLCSRNVNDFLYIIYQSAPHLESYVVDKISATQSTPCNVVFLLCCFVMSTPCNISFCSLLCVMIMGIGFPESPQGSPLPVRGGDDRGKKIPRRGSGRGRGSVWDSGIGDGDTTPRSRTGSMPITNSGKPLSSYATDILL